MKTGIIEFIDGYAAVVENRDDKMTLAFVVQQTRAACEVLFSPGEMVSYRVLWDGGWEGEGAEITDRNGKEHRAHMQMYVAGQTAAEIAANLNLEEDDVALGLAGIRRAE